MTRIAFIGGGGFAKEVLEIAKLNGHEVIGYVGDSEAVIDRPYWGSIDQLLSKRDFFDTICVAFGSVDRKSAMKRAAVTDWVSANHFNTISLVSPHAVMSEGVKLSDGAIIAHGAVLSVDSKIGAFAILNSNAIVGHDANIGSNSVIAPGAFIGGNVKIGENCLIGPGAMILEGRQIADNVVVGVGATVVRNVQENATVAPVRSRILK